ncbi:hypothetical protein HZ326_6952 [Fusarium oxysporum f. sp. albedinis]|nr:hypothetical protein HZ326_6952 [Fusarium oxysporum f. sp. albedinis]
MVRVARVVSKSRQLRKTWELTLVRTGKGLNRNVMFWGRQVGLFARRDIMAECWEERRLRNGRCQNRRCICIKTMSDTSPPERVTAIHRRTPSRHTRTFSLFHGAYHDDPCFGKGWQIDGLVDWALSQCCAMSLAVLLAMRDLLKLQPLDNPSDGTRASQAFILLGHGEANKRIPVGLGLGAARCG